jgi:glycosyltransferase involved in cell wall biosynthesis
MLNPNVMTIIIATYNSSGTLEQCLKSVYQNDMSNVQVIIKDGASTDDTVSIANQYLRKEFDLIFSYPDSGVYDAWNDALKHASGNWVTFLGSDDYYIDDTILRQIKLIIGGLDLKRNKYIYGKNTAITVDGIVISDLGENWELARLKLNKQMSIRHPGSFCHISIFEKIGSFDTSFKIVGDYDFTLSASKLTELYFYDFSSVAHRVGGLSIKPSRNLDVILETFKLRKKHCLTPRVLCDSLFFKRLTLFLFSKVIGDKSVIKLLGKFKK